MIELRKAYPTVTSVECGIGGSWAIFSVDMSLRKGLIAASLQTNIRSDPEYPSVASMYS